MLNHGEDETEALEASLLENTARLEPDEMQQFIAFKQLADRGRTIPEIAELFGIGEITVKRRLAIAGLLPAIRTLYNDDEINGSTLMALTLASTSVQKDWLALWQDEEAHAPLGRALKAWVLGGGEIVTSVALFARDIYDGQIIEDLFGENAVFADAEHFWKLQNTAIADMRDKLLAIGWSKVTLLERGSYFAQWQYLTMTKSQGGEVFIETRHTGEVVIHKGYGKAQKHISPDQHNEKKPELSKPLQNYLDLHRHAAVRAVLIGHHGTALRMLVAHLVVGSDLVRVMPDPERALKEETAHSVTSTVSQKTFEQESEAIAKLLGLREGEAITEGNRDGWQVCTVFRPLPRSWR